MHVILQRIYLRSSCTINGSFARMQFFCDNTARVIMHSQIPHVLMRFLADVHEITDNFKNKIYSHFLVMLDVSDDIFPLFFFEILYVFDHCYFAIIESKYYEKTFWFSIQH